MRCKNIPPLANQRDIVSRRNFLLASVAVPSALALAGCVSGSARDAGFRQRLEAVASGILTPVIPARTETFQPTITFQPELNAALADLSRRGGGRLVVPPGTYLSKGPIHLQSKCDLHLADGARIVFSPDPSHYLPVVFTRWEGTEAYNYSPFVYGRDLEDIAITGSGVLDGQGREHWLPWRDRQKTDQTTLRRMGQTGTPVEGRRFGEGHWLRPQFLQLLGCERVLIEGITLVDSPFWIVHPVYCRHVTVRGLTIISEHLNSDGVDPDSCEDVLIEDCDFNTGDDGIALKAGRDQDGWRVGRPCRRIVARNNRYSGTAGGGMAIGSEMSGGVEQVFVDGYVMRDVNHGLYLKSNSDRGGYVRDCHFRNIVVEKAKDLIVITNDYKMQGSGKYPASFRDISFSDIRCGESGTAISFAGLEDARIRDISVNRVHIETAEIALRTRNISRLTIEDVTVSGLPVEPAMGRDPELFQDARYL